MLVRASKIIFMICVLLLAHACGGGRTGHVGTPGAKRSAPASDVATTADPRPAPVLQKSLPEAPDRNTAPETDTADALDEGPGKPMPGKPSYSSQADQPAKGNASVFTGVPGVPFRKGAVGSFVAAANKADRLSFIRWFKDDIPLYLPQDKGRVGFGKFEKDRNGRPDASDFALNFYRQPAKGFIGPFHFEILPLSISTDGKALEHAKFRMFMSSKRRARPQVASIAGRSWSYGIGPYFVYRWRALRNDTGLYGLEVLAQEVTREEQKDTVSFFYDALVYYYKDSKKNLYVAKTRLTLPSQYVPQLRMF